MILKVEVLFQVWKTKKQHWLLPQTFQDKLVFESSMSTEVKTSEIVLFFLVSSITFHEKLLGYRACEAFT
jgi:hypothetical protein